MSYHSFVSDLWDPQNGNFGHFYQKIAFRCFLLKSVVFDFFLVKKLSTFTFYESRRFETKRLETPKILWWKIACLKLFSVGCKETKFIHWYYPLFGIWNPLSDTFRCLNLIFANFSPITFFWKRAGMKPRICLIFSNICTQIHKWIILIAQNLSDFSFQSKFFRHGHASLP